MNVTSACPSTGFLKNPFAAFAEVVVFRVYRWFPVTTMTGISHPLFRRR
jgi:hypothetical protein